MNCTHNCNQGRDCTCRNRWPDEDQPRSWIDTAIEHVLTGFGWLLVLLVCFAAGAVVTSL